MEKLDDSKMGAVSGHLIVHCASFLCWGTKSNWRFELEMADEDDQALLTDHSVLCFQCDAAKMTELLRWNNEFKTMNVLKLWC